jgi:DNA-binding LytR/AlgR family response regulator
MKAVNLAAETYLTRNLTTSMQFNGELKSPDQDHLFVKTTNKLQKVYFDDILYIEAMKDYVKIKTTRDLFISLNNMKSFLLKLPSSRFVRIHKSFAIPMDKIDALKKNSVEIAGIDIPVGQTFRSVLNSLIRQ